MKSIDFAEIEIGNLEHRIEELLIENTKLKEGNLIVWSSNRKLQAHVHRLEEALRNLQVSETHIASIKNNNGL